MELQFGSLWISNFPWNSLPCFACDRRSPKDRKRSGPHLYRDLHWPLEKAPKPLVPVQICSFGLKYHVKLPNFLPSLWWWNIMESSYNLGGRVVRSTHNSSTRAGCEFEPHKHQYVVSNFFFSSQCTVIIGYLCRCGHKINMGRSRSCFALPIMSASNHSAPILLYTIHARAHTASI